MPFSSKAKNVLNIAWPAIGESYIEMNIVHVILDYLLIFGLAQYMD